MPKDFLKDAKDHYDVVVIGSGLGGLTSANILARQGYSVLLLEHHYQLGGMATWFKRAGGHIFDISLHGFPIGMIKSCRKYWTQDIADSIVQLKGIRFENPQFSVRTTFDRKDFTQILTDQFKVEPEQIHAFFDKARGMNFYDDQTTTTRQLFEEFFPGRDDVVRLLMEPITYANGSTLEDPAITYGIVFSNFMSKGVYTFEGGTDALVGKMKEEMLRNGVDLRIRTLVEKIEVGPDQKVKAVVVNGRRIGCNAVVSNANLKSTILKLTGEEHFSQDYLNEANNVRLNSSSCQVYMALKPGETFDDSVGDLLFHSEHRGFDIDEPADDGLCEGCLVGEMVKERALGDMRAVDDPLDGRAGVSGPGDGLPFGLLADQAHGERIGGGGRPERLPSWSRSSRIAPEKRSGPKRGPRDSEKRMR